ncbi:MAG: molybdopterin molybdotransferase MoeA [Desulfurococcales archaeon]|nr:molybdopterin molybdotransferase MoeA [Desulfurococcales archaeon]
MTLLERLHSVSEAQKVLERVLPNVLRKTRVPLLDSVSYISAEDVVAGMDLPPFDRSVLDGYAVRWIDISSASSESPSILRLRGSISVGEEAETFLGPREAFEVQTGSRIPEGSNTVVPREYAERRGDTILVYKSFPPGYGVSPRGEDVRENETILRHGDVISEWHVGMLASLGLSHVSVWDKLRVVVASTGDELVEPGQGGRRGFFASTGYAVASYLNERGAHTVYKGVLGDDPSKIESFIAGNLESWDAIVLTGGTSVGTRDYTAKVIRRLADDYVHGVALTPGRPGVFASIEGKPVIGLSGMPVAALSQLIAVWDPAYRRIVGKRDPWEPVIVGVMAKRYKAREGMTNIVFSRACRNVIKGLLWIDPLKVTGSGVLSVLVRSNVFMVIPEEVTGLDEGETIEARVTGPIGRCSQA